MDLVGVGSVGRSRVLERVVEVVGSSSKVGGGVDPTGGAGSSPPPVRQLSGPQVVERGQQKSAPGQGLDSSLAQPVGGPVQILPVGQHPSPEQYVPEGQQPSTGQRVSDGLRHSRPWRRAMFNSPSMERA